MLHRVALSMVLIGGLILGCSQSSSFSYDQSQRPAAAGTGEVVAKVLVFSGRVEIQAANGHRFEAKPEQPLLATDTVAVPAAGFAILQLANNHLTRLDADVRLRLADAAALSAPAAQHSIQQQLTRLLTPAERSRTERIVGWHARMSAAEGVAVQSEEKAYAHKAVRDFAAPAEDREEEASAATDDGARRRQALAPEPSTPAADAVPAPEREARKGPPATKSKAALRPKLEEKRVSALRKAPLAPPKPQPVAKPAPPPPPPPVTSAPGGGKGVTSGGGDKMEGRDLEQALGSVARNDVGGGMDGLAVSDSVASARGGRGVKKKAEKREAAKDLESAAVQVQLVSWRRQGVQVKKEPAPARLRWLIHQVALSECLGAISPKLKHGQTTRLVVWVKGRRLSKLAVPGRSAASACISESFMGKPASEDMPDGVYMLVVRVK